MADLTLERPGPTGDDATPLEPDGAIGRNAVGGAPPGGPKVAAFGAGASSGAGAAGAAAIDPRAVRVAIGVASRLADEPAVVVAPSPEPPASARPTLAGKGPLGGVARDPAPEPGAEGVSSDRAVASATGATADPTTPATEPAPRQTVLVDDRLVAARLVPRGPGRAELVVGEGSETRRHRIVLPDDGTVGTDGTIRREVVVDGWRIEVELEPERRAALRERARRGHEAAAHGGPTEVRAIIPGRVVSVSVVAGDPVAAGQQVLVVEAMKMQNELRAPRDGTIRTVAVAVGTTIEVGDLLLVIE